MTDTFDPADIARTLDDAASQDPTAIHIEACLRGIAAQGGGIPDHISWPFKHMLEPLSSQNDATDWPYTPLTPQYPPAIADVDDEVLEVWDHLLECLTHPFPIALYADFIWHARHGEQPYRRAQQVVDAYLATAGELLSPAASEPDAYHLMEAVTALQRAAVVAKQLNDNIRIVQVDEALSRHLNTCLDSGERRPGAVLGLLDALDVIKSANPIRQSTLENIAATTDDPWIYGTAMERLANLTPDPTAKTELRRRIVDRWIDRGDEEKTLGRLMFYQKAAETADRYGLVEHRETAQSRLEGRPPQSEEFTRISATVELDEDDHKAQVARLSDGASWSEALPKLLLTGPLTGEPEGVLRSVREERNSLSGLFPMSVHGAHGAVIKVIPGGIDGLDDAVKRHEDLRINISAQTLLVPAIRRMIHNLGKPDPEEIHELFEMARTTADIAEPAARAVAHHAEGCFDEAVHILYPRIEHAVRSLAQVIGLTVTNPPRGLQPGGVKTLGTVLREVSAINDEPLLERWWNYVSSALIEPLSANIRNYYAHALGTQPGTETHSAVLIHITLFLNALDLTENEGP